ncbi:hypothetical protein D9B52_00880 [Corynebacterium diphtheriae]|nr:hypothetical protein D9B34_00920 [Corynebacterium diphtheriae]RKW97885.1 hypothetical protein D9B52_00880 [Corynebacterium diphtheriae]RKX06673.1 hypothetical protein D9C01_00895 [Corynebacterium diphtheriae]RNF50750.1 hypothetical protein EFE07_00890 [Corynebacterium diphtheriae]
MHRKTPHNLVSDFSVRIMGSSSYQWVRISWWKLKRQWEKKDNTSYCRSLCLSTLSCNLGRRISSYATGITTPK